MPRWNPQVYVDKQCPPLYYAYAVHTNGKIEAAGCREDLDDATLLADELANMLTKHHRYAGQYKGTDALIGTRVSQNKIEAIIKDWAERTNKYMQAHKKIFGKKK
ncbi:MAG: hypothetical protein M0R80_02760 [Proteobacteria bacterium]|jgi:hypothetical protein|nr:hypothetical protein [Pseudomonadota bacterium]